MPNYENGKIYKIVCNITNKVYYGSSTQKLYTRIAEHRSNYKRHLAGNGVYMTSYEILKGGDYDIVLIENVKCVDKSQLHEREKFYIKNNDCVNKCVPGRTKKEFYIDYYNNNKDKIKETLKEYYNNNKANILEIRKDYYNNNKDKIKEYKKEYRKVKVPCVHCNKSYHKSSLSRHIKTKHKNNP